MTEQEADSILGGASDVWRTSDSSDDVECDTAICRGGNVTTFNVGNGIISTEAELNEVFDLPGYIKVVGILDFCEGKFDPTWIGCASGNTFVVERLVGLGNLESVLWAHEYGHTRGLGHNSCPTGNEVMCRRISSGNRVILGSECDNYGGPRISMPDVAAAQPAETGPGQDIKDYIRQLFIHGIPYEEVTSKYDSTVVPTLLGMLADPQEEAYWVNIVVVLGMLGDERFVDSLITFIKEPAGGTTSPARFKAKVAAITALGHLVHRTKSAKALEYLQDGVNPEMWTRRGIDWSSPFTVAATDGIEC